ncbi:MAG TPA: FeoA family protein [Terriglobales bacterium]|jgi:Fe2+ transport system protein FeoA|nr:FeoA family protein [Terriglobales bacterium]
MIFNFRVICMARQPKTIVLPDLPQGQSALIARVDDGLTELLEIGFVPGVPVRPMHSGLGGDPRVYELEGTLVALRRTAARHIHVTLPDAGAREGD